MTKYVFYANIVKSVLKYKEGELLEKNRRRALRRVHKKRIQHRKERQLRNTWSSLKPNATYPLVCWFRINGEYIRLRSWEDLFLFRKELAKRTAEHNQTQHGITGAYASQRDIRAHLNASEQISQAGHQPPRLRHSRKY